MPADGGALPPPFLERLESEFRLASALPPRSGAPDRAAAGRLTSAELDRAARSLLGLQRGLTGQRALIGEPYMDEASSFGAYLLYYWPASFLQIGRALDQCGGMGGRGRAFGRVLDLGSGPGPASAACALRGSRSILALDPSARALDAAGRLLSGLGAEFRGLRWSAGEPLPESGPWDLIILSHSLNEIHSGSPDRLRLRADFLMSLSERLAPGGLLLLMEPALLATSRELIGLRDELLRRGMAVAAPCLFKGPCPALAAGENQTCHDQADWTAPYFADEIAQRAGLSRPELKMAWFALGRRDGDATGPDSGKGGAGALRVVSDPMLNKAGRTRYAVCGASGRHTLSAKLSELTPGCSDFMGLKRGTLIRASGTEARGEGGAGLISGSVLEIIG
jgi:SAM-dependent methyltransferase